MGIDKIIQLKKGDSIIFQEVYTLYFNRVYNLCYSYTKDKDLTNDLVQDAFIKIWKNRKKISEVLPIEQQLFVITKNLIFDHFRRKVKEEEVLIGYNSLLNQQTPDDTEFSNVRLQKIFYWIEQLPKKQQKVFKMYRFQGMTYQEIASILNISKHTVSAQISSGMSFIKKNINQFFL